MIYVLGDGPYAREVFSIYASKRITNKFTFIGEGNDKKPGEISGGQFIMGVANPRIKMRLVVDVYHRKQFILVQSKMSTIMDEHQVGYPVSLGHFSSIGLNTKIGQFVSICNNVAIGHDIIIGDYVTIAPGAIISGFVTIGEGAFIGAGAVIKPGVNIGAWSIIGCGANVVKDVEPRSTVIKNPAIELNRASGI